MNFLEFSPHGHLLLQVIASALVAGVAELLVSVGFFRSVDVVVEFFPVLALELEVMPFVDDDVPFVDDDVPFVDDEVASELTFVPDFIPSLELYVKSTILCLHC